MDSSWGEALTAQERDEALARGEKLATALFGRDRAADVAAALWRTLNDREPVS